MRKVGVVAAREYRAAVRTKSFVISLVAMPVLMFGSIGAQWLVKDLVDTKVKRFAVVDRSPGRALADAIEDAVRARNEAIAAGPGTKRPKAAPFVLERIEPPADTPGAVDRLRLELSDRVRDGDLFGVLTIGPDVLDPHASSGRAAVRYQTETPTYPDFAQMAGRVVDEAVRDRRLASARLPREAVLAASRPVPLETRGLTRRDEATGAIVDDPVKSPLELFFIPFVLTMLMYMQVMFGAAPLMQGVLEEKSQRIAEVLLGSVRPFELMMGKFLGMVAVSLTIAAVYLGGGYFAARHYGYATALTPALLAWFVAFQVLAVLMYGAMFTAVGAACADAKEAQSLLWPVMMLIIVPMFLLVQVIREPNTPLAVGASLVPFATPILMVARMAVPPGVPGWQPALAAVLMLATTVACVYAAGRIFRVGLLMQGKGARLGDLARWVLRG